VDRSFVEKNRRELERLRKLVERLDDRGLQAHVNEHWTVAGVLGHVAFWDLRALQLAERLASGEDLSPDDAEEGDVDWINDAMRPLLHAIPPRALAEIALRTAEDTDERVASLDAHKLPRLWPTDPASPLNPSRADHRGEHLDEIEKALGR
jgi:Mycothiol maleylpyruvate isomerase N-terminal domain